MSSIATVLVVAAFPSTGIINGQRDLRINELDQKIENGIDKVKEDIMELDQKIENGIDKVKEDSKELDQKIEKVMSLIVEKKTSGLTIKLCYSSD